MGFAHPDEACQFILNEQTMITARCFYFIQSHVEYIDMDNNKVYLQAAITTMGMVQYSSVEADYDFDKEELKAYRFYSNVMTSFVDMALTEDNKYMWYETSTESDDVASAITAKKQEFLNRSAEISKLESSFDEEIQI